jgi:hypothetical protein
MANSTRSRAGTAAVVLASVLGLAIASVPASAEQGGTTLSASMTASGHTFRTYGWSISETASPDSWDLSWGQSGTSGYTISVERGVASEESDAEGQICVTNRGDFPTENLQIAVVVQQKVGAGMVLDQAPAAVDVGAKAVLSPGEGHCYPYAVRFSSVPGAAYVVSAKIAITNFEGWMPGDPACPGAAPCRFGVLLSAPLGLSAAETNGTITVVDSLGGSWSFGGSGIVIHDRVFTCDADAGSQPNVATIVETGQSASASVQVNCLSGEPDPGPD